MPTSTTDPRRPPRDLRATNRQDPIDAAVMAEVVTTLEDAERIARRVLGGEHPTTTGIEKALRHARVALRARETGTDLATALATLFIDSL